MKKLVSLLLCAGFCMGLAIPGHAAGTAYEEAVAGLRKVNYGTYGEEQSYDSDLCTLFSYSVTARHGPFAHLDLVYKAGSPLGEGTVISLPVPDQNAWGASSAPETLDWDPEGGRLSYSYYFDTPIYAQDFSSLRRAAGTFTYTVDLHTGEIAESHTPPLEPARTYDQAVAELRGRSSGYCCETVYESELCSVFSYSISGTPHGTFSFLELVYKAGAPLGEGVVLNLPLIKINDWQVTISPDEITLNEDKTVLTYKYHFDASLTNGDSDRVYYKAGTYTYTVDLATGELEVAHTDEVPYPPQPAVSVFTDVPAGSWFEKGVATCAGKGVMVGTGGDSFSPERELSQAECLTLAFRLYDLMQGNEHAVEKASEDWGKMTLTLADGTVFEGYGYQSEVDNAFSWWGGRNGYEGVCAQVPGWTYEDLEAGARAQQEWMDAHEDICGTDAPATLTLNGAAYQGTAACWMPVGPYVLMFQPEAEKAREVNPILHHAVFREAGPDRWWRDTAYTITQRELEDIFDPVEFSSLPASRSFFAQLIADACEGHLEKINTIGDIPDLPREFPGPVTYPKAELYRDAVYALYEAGILTGVDQAGTFAAGNTLTRAEAAVMVARALDETQRITAPPQGGVTVSIPTQQKFASYQEALASLTTKFPGTPDAFSEERKVEWSLETQDCTVALTRGMFADRYTDYSLLLIYKPGSPQGEGTVRRLLLPSTVYNSDYLWYMPTNKAPDSYLLDQEETTLTYLYAFYEPLTAGDTVLHEAGTYVYTADLATGEVTAYIDPLSLLNLSYYEAFDGLRSEEGYQSEHVMDSGPSVTLLRSKACDGDPKKRDYELYLLYKAALPHVHRLALPSTEVLPDGSAPTTREPETLEYDYKGATLTYTYRFQEPLWDGDSLLHDKGTYVYTVDIATAEQSVRLENAYEHALAEVTMVGGTWRVDQQFETPLRTILVQHSEGGDGLYPGAGIDLIFKEGSPNGAGEVVSLPTKTGRSYYGSIPPHSVSLNEEKTVFTYTYQFDEDQYAVDKSLYYHPTYKAGTYTTTVDLMNGTANEVFVPKE